MLLALIDIFGLICPSGVSSSFISGGLRFVMPVFLEILTSWVFVSF